MAERSVAADTAAGRRLTEEDVEALKEFFLTPTDVIDFLKHL